MNHLEYTTEDEAVELIADELNMMNEARLIEIHSEYCDLANYPDDKIFMNDEEFFEIYFSDTMEAVRAVCFGEYDYNHEFVKFDGYANLESSNHAQELLDVDELAQYIFDNSEQFSNLPFELEEVEEEEEVETETDQ